MRAPLSPGMAPTTPSTTLRSSLALRRIALLEGLSDQRLDLLAQQCLWHSVEAGKPLLVLERGKSSVLSSQASYSTWRDFGAALGPLTAPWVPGNSPLDRALVRPL